MKQIVCILLFCVLSFAGQAQSLTVEYNIGYGTYDMADMKRTIKEADIQLKNVKVTDNFPGYLTQDFRIGVAWKRHHTGLLLTYMNTAGKKGVSDYSGYCYSEIRNKGYKLGAFYRFSLTNAEATPFSLHPYLQFSAGTVLNRVVANDILYLNASSVAGSRKSTELSGANFFIEPAVGCKFYFCRYAALNLSVGYEWDAVRKLHLATDKDAQATIDADWSGLRLQAGIICYIPLLTKK